MARPHSNLDSAPRVNLKEAPAIRHKRARFPL
jgi:hypothetical protein